MALHEQSVGASDEWYTPSHVFTSLGCSFDLDVASPGQHITPWIPAAGFIERDSLSQPWSGFIWMNAPFGRRGGLVPWLEKFFDHHDGIALVPDRTSCPWWQRFAPTADLILFVAPKIRFISSTGKPGKSPAQGTSLFASGPRACEALQLAATRKLGVLLQPWVRS